MTISTPEEKLKKVLLIEDDVFIRQLLSYVFKSMGFAIIETDSGAKALTLLMAERPDVIVTDINMPGMDGFETIIEIRKIIPDTKIIAISGGGTSDCMDNLERAKMLGANYILKKPFLPTDIQEIMKKI